MSDIDNKIDNLIRNAMTKDLQYKDFKPNPPDSIVKQDNKQFLSQVQQSDGYHSTLKQKVLDLKDQVLFKDEQLHKCTEELIQLKAEKRLLLEQTQQNQDRMKFESKQLTQQMQDRFKVIIDKLINEKQELAAKTELLAQQVLNLQTSQKQQIFEQNKQIQEELSQLKMNFNSKIQAKTQQLESQYAQKLRLQVQEAVERSERQLSQKIEPEIQKIVSEKQIQLIQLKTQLETEKLQQLQQQQEKLYQEFEQVKQKLLQQKDAEIEGKIQSALKSQQLQNADTSYSLNQKLRQQEEEFNHIQQEKQKRTEAAMSDLRQELERKIKNKDLQLAEMAKSAELQSFQFETLKRQLQSEYAQQVQEIRQSFREFALGLHKAYKHDLVANLESAKQKTFLQIARESDDGRGKLQAELDETKHESFVKVLQLTTDYEAEVTKLKTQNSNSERELSVLKQSNSVLVKQLREISDLTGQNLQEQAEKFKIFEERGKMAAEDYFAREARMVKFSEMKEQRLFKSVQTKVLEIVRRGEGDARAAAERIQQLTQQNAQLQQQLREIEDL